MLIKLILEERVTYSHCVPTILQMLVASPICKKFDLSYWKVIIGGARLPKGLAKAALDLGIQVMAGYGMSETCPVISVSNLKPSMKDYDNEKKSDVVIKTGIPVSLVDVRIADPQGNFLPNDGRPPVRSLYAPPGSPRATTGTRKRPRNSGAADGSIPVMWVIWMTKGTSRSRTGSRMSSRQGASGYPHLTWKTPSAPMMRSRRRRPSAFPTPSGERGPCCWLS